MDEGIYMEAPHVASAEEVLAYYKTTQNEGLSDAEAERRELVFGLNELEHGEGKGIWELIAEQFEDLLVRILLLAAVVSFVLASIDGDDSHGIAAYVEPMVILIILILNAAVGVWQEQNAERALDALKELQPALARVCRSGNWKVCPSANLVPGDIIDLRCGDKVPADCRILSLKSTALKIEQSQLTGESVTVTKDPEPLDSSLADCEVQSKKNMCFSSTIVAGGHAVAVVACTGMSTEIGKIQAAVQQAAEEEDQETPLQKKIDEFGSLLSKVIFGICVIVWIINIGHFSDPIHGSLFGGCVYYFKIAVALAVAAIPEGLPAVITTCLALGTRRMAQKNAIVRRILSVETLGCTTVICSDKTGTLTTNEMSCTRFCIARPGAKIREYKCEGTSYSPVGCISSTEDASFDHITNNDQALQWFARCASLCNEARLEYKGATTPTVFRRKSTVSMDSIAHTSHACTGQTSTIMADGGAPKYTRIGEPTEAALLVLVEKLGTPEKKLNSQYLQTSMRLPTQPTPFCDFWTQNFQVLSTLEFTRDRKSMSVLTRRAGETENTLFVKGAPESIIERCTTVMMPDGSIEPISAELRATLLADVSNMAEQALRTLALAVRMKCDELATYDPSASNAHNHPAHKSLQDSASFSTFESDLTFLGLVGLLDPPRPEVKHAIKQCRDAGIKVVMITGDNKLTAEAIAEKVGIMEKNDPDCPSFTGKEFEALSLEEKMSVLSKNGAIFSRTEPKHKQLIVKLLKELGETTAMTGDGVNDAPALKQADIGVAMGISGTEVAKEAADMVLADDNFNTIVSAVEEGRSIYNNMKAFIRYLISSNIGEVASIFLTAALGIPEGLSPVQLLWVNLVTDGPPATALGFNPADADVMEKPPRHKDDQLIDSWIFFRYMMIGIYVGLATVGIFVYWYVFGSSDTDMHTLITFSQLANWGKCSSWTGFKPNTVFGMSPTDPCSYFTYGKAKASTLSLTVLVVIEMLNAFNALSENHSLTRIPPWANPYLMLATCASIGVHCCILYIPFLSGIFGVVPLTLKDWWIVFLFSIPVIFIDEALKYYGRLQEEKYKAERLKKKMTSKKLQ